MYYNALIYDIKMVESVARVCKSQIYIKIMRFSNIFYKIKLVEYNTTTRYGYSTIDYVYYSTFDIYYEDGTLAYESDEISDEFKLELTVSPSELTTNVPIMIHTQNISTDSILNYNLEYSLDNENWASCNTRSISDVDGNSFHQFYYECYKNELIYFRFQNIETGECLYDSVSIENIIIDQDSYNNYIDGVFRPTPFLTYEYINDTLITVKTQKFFEEEIRKLECSYIKYTTDEDYNNEELWTSVDICSFYDELTKQTTYQFYFDIDNSDYTADGDYFVRFYNKETEEYTVASMNVIFQSIIDYQQSLNEVNSKLDVFIDFFKERFGFLTYPFELIVDVLQRFLYISFEEPILRIPDINEPFTGVKLISATEFNFNDMLENETLKSVHDIYLIFVDAIIILGLVNLCRIKLMGVFVK